MRLPAPHPTPVLRSSPVGLGPSLPQAQRRALRSRRKPTPQHVSLVVSLAKAAGRRVPEFCDCPSLLVGSHLDNSVGYRAPRRVTRGCGRRKKDTWVSGRRNPDMVASAPSERRRRRSQPSPIGRPWLLRSDGVQAAGVCLRPPACPPLPTSPQRPCAQPHRTVGWRRARAAACSGLTPTPARS